MVEEFIQFAKEQGYNIKAEPSETPDTFERIFGVSFIERSGNMKNILSYNNGNFSGKEIKNWICYHTDNQTEYARVAKSMTRYIDTLVDDRMYKIELSPSGTGCREKKRYQPNVILVE